MCCTLMQLPPSTPPKALFLHSPPPASLRREGKKAPSKNRIEGPSEKNAYNTAKCSERFALDRPVYQTGLADMARISAVNHLSPGRSARKNNQHSTLLLFSLRLISALQQIFPFISCLISIEAVTGPRCF